jgi:hypothetical protein
MTAFGEAVAINDEAALKGMLGADFQQFIPPVGADIHAPSSSPGPGAGDPARGRQAGPGDRRQGGLDHADPDRQVEHRLELRHDRRRRGDADRRIGATSWR